MEASSYAEQVLKTEAPTNLANLAADNVLGELYDAHAATVYRLLLAMLRSTHDAQDALSDVFLKLSRQNLKRIKHPRAYLLMSARNQAIAILRQRKRELPTDPDSSCFFDVSGCKPEQVELANNIEQALGKLPIEQREVIILKIYEEMTFHAIAKITRTSQNTAASRYRYAVEKLRELLKD